LLSGGTVVEAINCGQLSGGTITIGPNSFSNEGTLQASDGGTLEIRSSVAIGDAERLDFGEQVGSYPPSDVKVVFGPPNG
jgi:hypothetical protein